MADELYVGKHSVMSPGPEVVIRDDRLFEDDSFTVLVAERLLSPELLLVDIANGAWKLVELVKK